MTDRIRPYVVFYIIFTAFSIVILVPFGLFLFIFGMLALFANDVNLSRCLFGENRKRAVYSGLFLLFFAVLGVVGPGDGPLNTQCRRYSPYRSRVAVIEPKSPFALDAPISPPTHSLPLNSFRQ